MPCKAPEVQQRMDLRGRGKKKSSHEKSVPVTQPYSGSAVSLVQPTCTSVPVTRRGRKGVGSGQRDGWWAVFSGAGAISQGAFGSEPHVFGWLVRDVGGINDVMKDH